MSDNNQKKLERKIGLVSLIGLGVGATVGSGIFSTISEVASVAGSSLFLVLAFLVGALLQIPGSFCYAELTSAYTEDGGHYIYFREAGYGAMTFICGWLTFLAIDGPAVAVMAISIANYLSVFLKWNFVLLKIISALIVVAFAYIHIRSVELGGYVQAIMTVIKIIPFILIIGFGAFYIDPNLFMSSGIYLNENNALLGQSGGLFALAGAIALSTYSFDGLFAGCYVSGEIKNPNKTLPRGLVVTAIIVLLLYVGLSGVATGLMPIDQLAQSSAPIADMASKIPVIGNYAMYAIAGIAVVVIMGTISSCLLYMPRFEYAMAKDGLFFKVFSKVHPKYKSPYMAIIIFTLYVLVLIFIGNITDLLTYLTLIVLLKNCITYCLIFKLRKKSDYKPTYKSPCGALMPIISIISCASLIIFTLFSSSIIGLWASFIVIIIGFFAYLMWKKYSR